MSTQRGSLQFSLILFAWGTRATNYDVRELSFVGQTTITMSGALVAVVFVGMLVFDVRGTGVGRIDGWYLELLIFTSIASLAQFLWIRGAAGLDILLASLHMNAVPFYVMIIVVLFLDADWNWGQAAGARPEERGDSVLGEVRQFLRGLAQQRQVAVAGVG